METCAFKGCDRATNSPLADGWSHLTCWGPVVKDGYYCPEHVKALKGVYVEEFEPRPAA
jgi:hypothetical protein